MQVQQKTMTEQENAIQEHLYEIQQLNDEMDEYENKIEELNEANNKMYNKNLALNSRI